MWVASTFSHKPFFNRENLERYTEFIAANVPYTDIVTLKVAMKNWSSDYFH